jgi:hypothetical protein
MKNPKNFSMYGFTVLALVLSTLGLAPQIRADGYHNHGAQNFDHQNFDEASFRASFFKSSGKVNVSNNEKDKKDNDTSNSGPNLGNDDGDNGDNRDIDTDPGRVTTPEPAVYALLFAGLAGLFGFAALKKVKA